MGLAAWVGRQCFELASPAYMNCFFSTVYVRLDAEDDESTYPIIMSELAAGKVSHRNARAAIEEIKRIREGLAKLPPDQVVWDAQHREKRPPWGDNISPTINTLGNYFVTSDGKDLIEVLVGALTMSAERKKDLRVT